jgi:hypothetical protein
MLARERWSRENPGTRQGLCCITVAGGGGEGRGFSYLLESHMTYLASSHVPRSWPGIRLRLPVIKSKPADWLNLYPGGNAKTVIFKD